MERVCLINFPSFTPTELPLSELPLLVSLSKAQPDLGDAAGKRNERKQVSEGDRGKEEGDDGSPS